ncbi:Uncharacterised protein [Vibrio cholerae]|nr:Uncharacterised protein [Vibrio cholerae]
MHQPLYSRQNWMTTHYQLDLLVRKKPIQSMEYLLNYLH